MSICVVLELLSEPCIPGCSFFWMVATKESQTVQQFSTRNLPDLDHMAPLQLDQNYGLPYYPLAFTANVAFGQPNIGLSGPKSDQTNAVGESLKTLPPYWNNASYPIRNPCGKDSQFAPPHRVRFSDKPIDDSSAPKKRFLIFDRSGDQTRLFYSPYIPSNDQNIASSIPTSANGSCEKFASRVEHQSLVKPVVEDKWDENDDLNDGEGDMLEDTEEIDALLYSSDSDDENDENNDVDGENDEVTTTRDTLFISIKDGGYDKDKLPDELIEEVASCDGSPKRQRLLDGRYKKSSLMRVQSPARRASHENDDAESSYSGARNSDDDDDDDIDSCKREKKVKVRDALKILESIIPGLESKDPLSIIDKAIGYMEWMKVEAQALGLGYREGISGISPQTVPLRSQKHH